MSSGTQTLFTLFGVAVLILLIVWGRRRQYFTDGEWGVLVECSKCGEEFPRWFLTDKGTPRGPFSRTVVALPEACRRCRHTTGLMPLAWKEGETEVVYNQRSEQTTAERLARARR